MMTRRDGHPTVAKTSSSFPNRHDTSRSRSAPSSRSGLPRAGLVARADRLHDLPVGIRPPLPEVPAVPPGLPNPPEVDRGGDVRLLRLRAGGEDLGGRL